MNNVLNDPSLRTRAMAIRDHYELEGIGDHRIESPVWESGFLNGALWTMHRIDVWLETNAKRVGQPTPTLDDIMGHWVAMNEEINKVMRQHRQSSH